MADVMIKLSSRLGQRYAFLVAAVTFLALLTSAGMRSVPGVLMLPLESSFGWGRPLTSSSAALGIFLYGMVGPFAAALMQGIGIRRTLIGALTLMAAAAFLSSFMTQSWQYVATWGVLSGLGSGCVALVLGATVVNRWFVSNRGLVMGALTASTATGTLVFLPALAAIVESYGWRPVVWTVGSCALLLIPLVTWLLPERPINVGLLPYGAVGEPPVAPVFANPVRRALGILRDALKVRDFWLLAGTFFICGFTTNGIIGTHLIAFCADHGLPEVRAAGLLAMMGVFDLIGTTGSGWLTDRFNSRNLLFIYYGIRGIALVYLPFSDFSFYGLSIFAVFFGLDWIATVPPTLRLATAAFGEARAPVVFGWIVACHQIGAASASFIAGLLRSVEGTYLQAYLLAGCTAFLAAFLSLAIGRRKFAPALA
jgi:predicted MFS family arabinose efflux permease